MLIDTNYCNTSCFIEELSNSLNILSPICI